jgi:hypothetical protein
MLLSTARIKVLAVHLKVLAITDSATLVLSIPFEDAMIDLEGLRMSEVGHQDLVTRQELVRRDLVAFCRIEWEERYLLFHENQPLIQTTSVVSVRQPMYTSAIGVYHRDWTLATVCRPP